MSRANCTHGNCVYCSEVERAFNNDIAVVASAGNSSNEGVHCPSNSPSAISVAGVEFECTYSMPRTPRNQTNKPPLAYWTRIWSGVDDYPDNASDKAFCTTRDCWQNDGRCDKNMTLSEWDQNPNPTGDKPDVLAPIHYAGQIEEQQPFVWAASSFAAPMSVS